MKNYFEKLSRKTEKYKQKYASCPRAAALKLSWWNLQCAFKKLKNEIHTETHKETENTIPLNPDILRIAVAEGGGLGDSLIQTTYLKEIRKLFNKPVLIDFYSRTPKVFENFPFIDHSLPYPEHLPTASYDVFIISRRFYIINKIDWEKTKNFSKTFYQFCKGCKNLTDEILVGEFHDNLFTQYALLHDKNRIEQSNIKELIPLTRYTPCYFSWDENKFSILKTIGLTKTNYITISRAVGTKSGTLHPKLWPLPYYNKLIQKIKKAYPNIKIIQIGSSDTPSILEGIDINLVGQTDFEQLKIILKYALLHIDIEGGLVHMRHFLNGISAVIFGPTSPSIFGYEENINLQSSVCPRTCEWVTPRWTNGCIKGHKIPPCMSALTPETVFNAISHFLNTQKPAHYHIQPAGKTPISKGRTAFITRPSQEELSLFKNNEKNTIVFDNDMSCPNKQYPKNCAYITYAHRKKFQAEFASPYNIPAPDNSFDTVFCSRIETFSYPQYALKEMLRILKNKGHLYLKIKSPNPLFLSEFPGTENLCAGWIDITKNEGKI